MKLWRRSYDVPPPALSPDDEAVAALAAVDGETAEKAIELITVQYEPLPFVLDPEEAATGLEIIASALN